MKKVFLNNLPKKKHGDKLVIDWKNSIGYKVRFIYDDTQGEFEIIDYIKSRYSKIILKYNNKYFNIKILLFKNCNIGKIFFIGGITFLTSCCSLIKSFLVSSSFFDFISFKFFSLS